MEPENFNMWLHKSKKKIKGSFCQQLIARVDHELAKDRPDEFKCWSILQDVRAVRKDELEELDDFNEWVQQQRRARRRAKRQRFLCLPAELRQRILYYVFADD